MDVCTRSSPLIRNCNNNNTVSWYYSRSIVDSDRSTLFEVAYEVAFLKRIFIITVYV